MLTTRVTLSCFEEFADPIASLLTNSSLGKLFSRLNVQFTFGLIPTGNSMNKHALKHPSVGDEQIVL